MPIAKGSATFSRHRVSAAKKRFDLAQALRTHAFVPLDPAGEEERAQGFVEFGNAGGAEFTPGALYQGDTAVFAYRIDEVKIPSAAVKSELDKWARAFEEENGRKPGRKEKADQKSEVRHTLRARYPLASKTFDVSWNEKAGTLAIWAGSRKLVDEVQAALEKAVPVELTSVAPVAVAAHAGLAVDALKPTPELAGDLHGKA